MQPFRVVNQASRADLLLTCEHASCAVPVEYDDLGLHPERLAEHVGWDIGAADLTASLAARLHTPAVLSSVSRLLIDCNRDLADHDLIVSTSHDVDIPGNRFVDDHDRRRRIRDFYEPYHTAVDAELASRPQAMLLSVHSFTPSLNGRERRFDVGVLFDVFAADAEKFGTTLQTEGVSVRYNQPYSGLEGLIFSARSHGMQHDRRYLEIEVNNRLLRDRSSVDGIAGALAVAIQCWLEGPCD